MYVCLSQVAGHVGGTIALQLGRGTSPPPLGHVLHQVGGVGVTLRHTHKQITNETLGLGVF